MVATVPQDQPETEIVPKKPLFLDVPALGIDLTYPIVGNVFCFGNTIESVAVIRTVLFGRPVARMERLDTVVATMRVERFSPVLRSLGIGTAMPVFQPGTRPPNAPIPLSATVGFPAVPAGVDHRHPSSNFCLPGPQSPVQSLQPLRLVGRPIDTL